MARFTGRLVSSPIRQMRCGTGSNEAVKRAVAPGLGHGCLSNHAVADALAQGWLVKLRTPLRAMRRALSVVMHKFADRRSPLSGRSDRGAVRQHASRHPRFPTRQLEQAIRHYIKINNSDPKRSAVVMARL